MTAQTGRAVGKYFKFQIGDSSNVMRDIPILTIGGLGVSFDEIDVMALNDLFHSILYGHGTIAIPITGPFSSGAAVTASGSGESAAAKLSGSHTVLEPLNGVMTPRSFGAYFGVRHDWETGEHVFGGVQCMTVNGYTVDPSNMQYSCKLNFFPDVTAPDWGTSAIAGS